MERSVKRVIVIWSITALLAGAQARAGNPIGDFFKRLGDSIVHPQKSPPPRRYQNKSAMRKKQIDGDSTVPPDGPSAVSPSPTPAFILSPRRAPMPVPIVVRSAAGVAPTKRPPRDLPYGIPVPNKPGFVTSPYAPKTGYVDVRNFPSGTEVTDPYTGKAFLVP